MTMKLYYSPGTIAVAVAIALHEAGLEYEAVRLDFEAKEQAGAGYLAINPKGRVPALQTSQGVLTETGAILDYIGAIASGAGLVPGDAFAAARMRAVMYYLASTAHVNHAHKHRGARWADRQESWDDMTARVLPNMIETATYLETHCLAGDFVLGDAPCVADPYLFAVCTWLPRDGVDMADFPRLRAFMDRMEARPSVRAVREAGILP